MRRTPDAGFGLPDDKILKFPRPHICSSQIWSGAKTAVSNICINQGTHITGSSRANPPTYVQLQFLRANPWYYLFPKKLHYKTLSAAAALSSSTGGERTSATNTYSSSAHIAYQKPAAHRSAQLHYNNNEGKSPPPATPTFFLLILLVCFFSSRTGIYATI